MGLRLLFEEQGLTDFETTACDTTFAIAVSPHQSGSQTSTRQVERAIYRTLSASMNSIGLAADRLCAALGFTGHQMEASTYLIKVRNSRSAVEAQAVDDIRMVRASPSISVCVAICTQNGATQLTRGLESLEELKYPSELLQVSIIDNGSTDQTRQIAEAWCARRTNAVYLREARAGLPSAPKPRSPLRRPNASSTASSTTTTPCASTPLSATSPQPTASPHATPPPSPPEIKN